MYKRLLVPTDGSELSEHAIQTGLMLARQLGAELIGFVVEEAAPLPASSMHLSSYARAVSVHDIDSERHAQRLLARFAAAAAKAGVPFEGRYAIEDDIPAAIARAAARFHADMIVMTTHDRSTLGELLFGSHTKRVMALSRTPLLVIH